MQSVSTFLRRIDKNTFPELVLTALWIAGTFLGLLASRFHGDAYASFLQPLPGLEPELGGVFASAIVPLLLSACAVILFHAAGCYGMCLLRGLSQGFLIGVIRSVYGSAAPLMTFLLTFSGQAVNVVLLFFWLRWLRYGSLGIREWCAGLFGLCAVAGVMDYLVIGPFLVDIVTI